MFSLAENCDTELYNKGVNKMLLYNYSDKTELCRSYRVVDKRDY